MDEVVDGEVATATVVVVEWRPPATAGNLGGEDDWSSTAAKMAAPKTTTPTAMPNRRSRDSLIGVAAKANSL